MKPIARALVIAALAWPVLLAAAVWWRAGTGTPAWTSVVYLAASRLCHQLPDRSFFTAGVQWPVCARCSGLYLSAPIGAVAAALSLRRRRSALRLRWWLAVAALPTAVTVALEWGGLAAPSNLIRAVAALPLGALVAYVIVRTAADAPGSIE
jgi:uncharacterized membrane protein